MMRVWMTTGAAALALAGAACGRDGAVPKSATPSAAGAEQAAVPAKASETRDFRDWDAVCDNGDDCFAMTGGAVGWVRVRSEPGPQGRASVFVGLWPEAEGQLTRPIQLIIDGRAHDTTVGPEDTSSGVIADGQVAAVLSELAAAKTVSLKAGAQTADLPTAGASAALLWIDERQGRIDTTTALIRRGARPASAVPPPPALPQVVAAAEVSQAGFTAPLDPMQSEDDSTQVVPAALEAVAEVKACREGTAFNPYLQKGVTASRLNATTELWGVPCDSGAYNVSYAYFLTGVGGTNAKMIRFPDAQGRPPSGEDGDGFWLVNPVYDPKTRTLRAFPRGRGLGDCGVISTWTWVGDRFVMSREQAMGECWGMVPDLWPTTYRTR